MFFGSRPCESQKLINNTVGTQRWPVTNVNRISAAILQSMTLLCSIVSYKNSDWCMCLYSLWESRIPMPQLTRLNEHIPSPHDRRLATTLIFTTITFLSRCVVLITGYCVDERSKSLLYLNGKENSYPSESAQNEHNNKPGTAPPVPGDRINDITWRGSKYYVFCTWVMRELHT